MLFYRKALANPSFEINFVHISKKNTFKNSSWGWSLGAPQVQWCISPRSWLTTPRCELKHWQPLSNARPEVISPSCSRDRNSKSRLSSPMGGGWWMPVASDLDRMWVRTCVRCVLAIPLLPPLGPTPRLCMCESVGVWNSCGRGAVNRSRVADGFGVTAGHLCPRKLVFHAVLLSSWLDLLPVGTRSPDRIKVRSRAPWDFFLWLQQYASNNHAHFREKSTQFLK